MHNIITPFALMSLALLCAAAFARQPKQAEPQNTTHYYTAGNNRVWIAGIYTDGTLVLTKCDGPALAERLAQDTTYAATLLRIQRAQANTFTLVGCDGDSDTYQCHVEPYLYIAGAKQGLPVAVNATPGADCLRCYTDSSEQEYPRTEPIQQAIIEGRR